MTQTVHTTNMTTLPTAMEMAAVTPSDRNLLMMLSSAMKQTYSVMKEIFTAVKYMYFNERVLFT